MIRLTGPILCYECPKKRTNYVDYELGFYFPAYRDDEHECHLTGRNINAAVEDRTVNRFCPLWVNREWPLRKNN